MKSLLLKDYFNIKHNIKQMFILMAFMALCMVPSTGTAGVTIYSAIVFCMMTITTFSFDEKSRWENYALVMPVSRKEYVLSKYIIHLIFGGAGAVLGLLIGFVAGLITGKYDILESLACGGIGLLLAIFAGCLWIPLIIRYGAEKARMIMIATVALPGVLVFGGYQLAIMMQIEFTKQLLIGMASVCTMVVLVLPFASYFLSVKWFRRKEF